jgi:fermentation-respiration switch protein FrsA (DUF1100 family)
VGIGLGTVASGYAVWVLASCFLQRCFVFPRYVTKTASQPGKGIAGLQKTWIATPQGKVEAWFAPVEGGESGAGAGPGARTAVGAGAPTPAVIHAHGNAEVIDGQERIIRGYRRLGVATMLCEYRGYGRSAGSPSQSRIVSDFVKCHDWLARRPGVDRTRIFFHGRSIGTGVVCALARKRTPAALILNSPFTSVRSLMARYLIPGFLVWDPFDNLSALRKYRGPVLILHGTRDTLVPIKQGRRLHRVARKSTLVEYDLGHNDLTPSRRYWSDVKRFLLRHGILRPRKNTRRHAGAI